MKNENDLSVIIVNYNSGNYLYKTIRSIADSRSQAAYEIIVVDNHSTDGSLNPVTEEFPDVKIITLDSNNGFAKANNIGAGAASGEYLLILNNDTEVREGSIDHLLTEIRENPGYGTLSPLLYYEDGTPQMNFGKDPGIISEIASKYFSTLLFRIRMKYFNSEFEKDKDWVSGACFIISSSLFSELDGFDENFFLYYEDADLGKRLRNKGYRNHITSRSRIVHFLGKSTGPIFSDILPLVKKGHLHYYKKHNSTLSFNLLKIYLLIRFNLKKGFAFLAGGKEKAETYKATINAIKDF